MGECYQWKAKEQCSKGDTCSFRHDESQRGNVTQSSSPALRSQTQNDGSPERKVKNRARITSQEIVRIRHVSFGILPCVRTTSLKKDVYMGDKCDFRHVRRRKAQQQVKERWWPERKQLGCVSQESHPRKCIPREPGN